MNFSEECKIFVLSSDPAFSEEISLTPDFPTAVYYYYYDNFSKFIKSFVAFGNVAVVIDTKSIDLKLYRERFFNFCYDHSDLGILLIGNTTYYRFQNVYTLSQWSQVEASDALISIFLKNYFRQLCQDAGSIQFDFIERIFEFVDQFMYLTDPYGRIMYVSDYMLKKLHYHKSDMLFRPLSSFIHEPYSGTREKLKSFDYIRHKHGVTYYRHVNWISKNGTLISTVMVPKAIYLTNSIVFSFGSEQRAASKVECVQINRLYNLYSSLLDTVDLAIIFIDHDRNILYLNDRFYELIGDMNYEGDTLEQLIDDFVFAEDRDRVKRALLRPMKKDKHVYKLKLRNRSGASFSGEITVMQRESGYVFTIEDITRQEESTIETATLHQRYLIQGVNDRVSHYVKTPLQALKLSTYLLDQLIEDVAQYGDGDITNALAQIRDTVSHTVDNIDTGISNLTIYDEIADPTIVKTNISNMLLSVATEYFSEDELELHFHEDLTISTVEETLYRSLQALLQYMSYAIHPREHSCLLIRSYRLGEDTYLMFQFKAPLMSREQIFELFSPRTFFTNYTRTRLSLDLLRIWLKYCQGVLQVSSAQGNMKFVLTLPPHVDIKGVLTR